MFKTYAVKENENKAVWKALHTENPQDQLICSLL